MSLIRLEAAVAVLVAAVTLILSTASAQDASRRIARIDIIRKNVFDPDRPEDRHAVGSLVNSLHVLTREDVIRRELLFREGDVFDEFLLLESARNLRARGYVGDIQTEVASLGDSAVAITVTTQDKWTIDLLPAYKQEGGIQAYRFTVKDDNLLGRAQSLSLSYDYDSGHPAPHGTEVTFRERNLLGSRFAASIRYRNAWDARVGSLGLERVYFSDRASWAGGLVLELGDRRYVYYRDGRIAESQRTAHELERGWLSASFGSATLVRPMVSYTRARSGLPAPRVFDNLDMLTAGVIVLNRSFVQRSFLDNFGRVEDVPLGLAAGVTLGRNFWYQPGLSPDYMVSLYATQAFLLGPRVYVGWEGLVTSYFGGECDHETTMNLLLLHHLKVSSFQTLVAWMTMTAGFGWSSTRQVYLGSSSGLRGFGEYEVAGNRRITYGIEHRMFSDVDIFIFRLGAAAFLDGGTAWLGDASLWRQRFHHAAGLGIRIENTKLQGAGLIRIDVAVNLDRRRFSQVILSSTLPMSAFLAMDGSAPWQAPENR